MYEADGKIKGMLAGDWLCGGGVEEAGLSASSAYRVYDHGARVTRP